MLTLPPLTVEEPKRKPTQENTTALHSFLIMSWPLLEYRQSLKMMGQAEVHP